MIIDDFKLLEQLYHENDNLVEYDELDLNDQNIVNELSKVKRISISFNKMDSNIENTIKQLNLLVNYCPNLEFVNVFSLNTNSKNININNLINSIIDNNIKNVSISGFDYDYLSLQEKILSSNSSTVINLDRINDIDNSLSYIFGSSELRKKLIFNSFGNEELNNLYNELRFEKKVISINLYEKYKDYLDNYNDLYISINNVSELDLDKLENFKNDNHLKGIYIKCSYNPIDDEWYYSFEEYEGIIKVINNIIQMIKMPRDDDPNREKIIFAQLYKILGQNIRYDHYAVTKEVEKNKELQTTCRNLKNGLLGVERDGRKQLLSVCAGYATILSNICACLNIKCDYISSSSKEIEIPDRFIISGTRQYENGTTDPMGHAYNAVYLDGKPYLCDLTWDANLMKFDKIGAHFLKNYDEFYRSHKDEGFSSDNVNVITQNGETKHSINPHIFINSISYEDQIELFGSIAKDDIDEMISENYLADFAIKNIEFIKQVKGKAGMEEYMSLIQLIHQLEDYIKSSKFTEKAANGTELSIPNKVVDSNGRIIEKRIIFYPGINELSTSDAIDEVTSMEEKQWKIR